MAKTFLTAEWRKLAMANYVVDAGFLQAYVPDKTELDIWNDRCYVSLVGFMFLNTMIMGIKVPFHINFEEVNLRFYVRYNDIGEWKRGVVFIKEIVPRHALTFVANTVYGENYQTLPMKHRWEVNKNHQITEYKWLIVNHWNSFKVRTELKPHDISNGSEEEFITEHYWGYTRINNRKTSEYGVEHPKWQVYKTIDYAIDVNFSKTYGQEFGFLDNVQPASVFVAEGSLIEVKSGRTI